MAGLYIHIPFCRKACHYCNFHFSTTLNQKDELVNCLGREIRLQSGYLQDRINSIYFGGGTPSLLTIPQIHQLLDTIKKIFVVDDDAEISFECNPDDISGELLAGWKFSGINRLSIGTQSFFDKHLQWMNRAHNSNQAKTAIELARQIGFENLTIDLIYGVPGMSDEEWKENVATAINLNVPHLSCYALTIEEGTALHKLIGKGEKENIHQDVQSHQFELLTGWLKEAGYEHYEISNFAKPGCRSRHNSSYWKAQPYLGIGPSAHSYNGHSRQWNVSNNSLYIQSLKNNIIPFEKEELTEQQRFNEKLMTSLRTMEGLSLQEVSAQFDHQKLKQLLSGASKFISDKMMINQDERLVLTEKGKLFADGIAAALFLV
ncbi:MAG: hemW [Chitinophagaceae bacterium]|nr:hemW [Chitinophagaceae bacterium]